MEELMMVIPYLLLCFCEKCFLGVVSHRDLQQVKGFGAQEESNRMKRVSSSKKLTGSWNYLFPRFYFILADEHFFMMAILALKLKTILVNFPFFPGHNSC